MSDKPVRVSCTSWIDVEVDVIANFDGDINIGEKIYDESEKCYTKKVKFGLTMSSADEIYELLKHANGDCVSSDCPHCKEVEEHQ